MKLLFDSFNKANLDSDAFNDGCAHFLHENFFCTRGKKVLQVPLQKKVFLSGFCVTSCTRQSGPLKILLSILICKIGVRGVKPPLHGSRFARVERITLGPVVSP